MLRLPPLAYRPTRVAGGGVMWHALSAEKFGENDMTKTGAGIP